MRCLLGDGGPARRRGSHPLDRTERVPGAGARAGWPGAGHRRGSRHAGRAAPGAAGDGVPRRLPVRLLHARLHLLDGRRVLPAGPNPRGSQRQRRAGGRPRARAERVRPARNEREPVPLHRIPPDPRRRLRAGPPARGRHVRPALRRARTRRAGDPGAGRRHRVRPARRPGRGGRAAGRAAGRHRHRRVHRLGRRGQPARHPRRVRGGRRPAARVAHVRRRLIRDRDRRRAHPVRGRAAAGRGGSRCWTSSGRSSRPG